MLGPISVLMLQAFVSECLQHQLQELLHCSPIGVSFQSNRLTLVSSMLTVPLDHWTLHKHGSTHRQLSLLLQVACQTISTSQWTWEMAQITKLC